MAVSNNSTFKVAYVSDMAKYNSITTKDPGTLYWVAGARKVYLDGVPYGFSDSDVTPAMLKNLIWGEPLGDRGDNTAVQILVRDGEDGKLYIGGQVRIGYDMSDPNLISIFEGDERGTPGIILRASTVQTIVDDTIFAKVTDKLGQADGIATLDSGGKVPSSQLPSYVDDIVEGATKSAFPTTGESGKIYVALDTNKTYRWTGTIYVEISESLALGSTAATAHRGDHGAEAYAHIQITSGNPHNVTKGMVGLGNVENYGIATETEAKTGTPNNKYMTPLRTAQAISALAPQLKWTVIS